MKKRGLKKKGKRALEGFTNLNLILYQDKNADLKICSKLYSLIKQNKNLSNCTDFRIRNKV